MLMLTGSMANEIGRSHLSLGDAGLYALLGYGVVFLGLVLLMIVVMLVAKCFTAADKRKAQKTAAPVEEVIPQPEVPAAPGTAGKLKLFDVDPKTAAILMAITANKMGKPINELRFISIKEVK